MNYSRRIWWDEASSALVRQSSPGRLARARTSVLLGRGDLVSSTSRLFFDLVKDAVKIYDFVRNYSFITEYNGDLGIISCW